MEEHFLSVAVNLDEAGLIWQPEIGDEVSLRKRPERVSILVDSEGMAPDQLRAAYLWLPRVEQLVFQFEVRQAILFHAGLELTDSSIGYKAVVRTQGGMVEKLAESLRSALGLSLLDILNNDEAALH